MESPISARAAILHVLTLGPGNGAELNARISERTKGALILNEGTLYPLLRRMEDAGLLASETWPRENGGRPSRVFRLTAKGNKAWAETYAIVTGLFGVE